MSKDEKWDFQCQKCGWEGLVDEPVYDDDNDGLAMCPDCGSKDMQLWIDEEEL